MPDGMYMDDDRIYDLTHGCQTYARGPNPARCVVGSGPRDDFVK